jgi:hypothetical protein
VGFLSVCWKP